MPVLSTSFWYYLYFDKLNFNGDSVLKIYLQEAENIDKSVVIALIREGNSIINWINWRK